MSEMRDVYVENAYGILINITAETGQLMAFAANAGAEHFAEVCVRRNGQSREFTLEDFLERLGFNKADNE